MFSMENILKKKVLQGATFLLTNSPVRKEILFITRQYFMIMKLLTLLRKELLLVSNGLEEWRTNYNVASKNIKGQAFMTW